MNKQKTIKTLANELEASLKRSSEVRRHILESLASPVDYDCDTCPDCKTKLSEPYKNELECMGCGNTFI